MNIPGADTLLSAIVRWRSRSAQPPAINTTEGYACSQRILLVLTTGIGDAVFSTATFPNIRKAHATAEIRLFCRPAFFGLFAADPRLDGLIPYSGKYRRFFRTFNELKDYAADLTIILNANDPDIIPMLFLAGCRRIVRAASTKTRFQYLLANRNRPEDAHDDSTIHYVDNRLRILDTLGIKSGEREPRVILPPLAPDDPLRDLLPPASYWVYHAFSADHFKDWPQENIVPLLKKTRQRWPQLSIILTGALKDKLKLESVVHSLSEPKSGPTSDPGVINLAGRLSLEESAQLITRAACVVAPDTGILHLAAALGTPVLGLYASIDHKVAGPRPQASTQAIIQKPITCASCLTDHCPYFPATCMNQISVDEVLEGLEQIFAQIQKGAALRENVRMN